MAPISKPPSLGRFRQLKGRLLDQWANRRVYVLIDFGSAAPLWWLLPQQGVQGSWFTRIRREHFIQALGPVEQREDKDFGSTADSYIGLLKISSQWRKRLRQRGVGHSILWRSAVLAVAVDARPVYLVSGVRE